VPSHTRPTPQANRKGRTPAVGFFLALLSGTIVAVMAVTSCFGSGFAWTQDPTPTPSPTPGNSVYHTALVTTGKDGWDTPVGEFRINYRVYDETMTSASIGAEEYYVLDHVLYTQYFTGEGHALHLNYWRPDSVFGHERTSHGCVGMRLADAEFFWNFVGTGSRVVVQP
jgi:lipoprotein-anchoring transpeptidase ErfK/SrfK